MLRLRHLLPASFLVPILLGACAGAPETAPEPEGPPPEPVAQEPAEQDPKPEDYPRAVPSDHSFDRVRLVSGEWIFGEILEVREDTLVIDSDILDEMSIDWGDIAEVRSERPMMVLVEEEGADDTEEFVDVQIAVDEDTITIASPDGTSREVERDELIAVIPGMASEANYWSGGFNISAAGRSGNVDQLDSSSRFYLKRETASTRGRADYTGVYSEIDGSAVAFNQRGTAMFDVFLSRRLFLRPAAVEYYRDPFQGIERRITPSAGLGYEILDTSTMGWDLTAGAGWQSTKYSGRQADGSFHDDQGTGIVMTNFSWDITSDAEFDLNYQIQAGFEDSDNVNHNLRAMLSVDFVGDFDLDVGFQWDRIGNPVPLEDGTIPQSDDYRVTVGLGWDF